MASLMSRAFRSLFSSLMSSRPSGSSWLRCRGQGAAAALWGRLALPIKWQPLDPGIAVLQHLHLVFVLGTHFPPARIVPLSPVCEVMECSVKQSRAQVMLLFDSSRFGLLLSHGICMRRCSLQADPFHSVYHRWCCVGRQISAFLPLSLPVSDALGYCCILRAGTAVLGKVKRNAIRC